MVSRTNKFRGRNRTHGRGKKAGRGAGKRGGRGNAGMNKHKVMHRLKYMPGHWGMHGFNRDPSLINVHVTCNLQELIKFADGKKKVDLSEFGIDKLLGSGKIGIALEVTVDTASAKAVEKIEAAGGSVIQSDEDWDEWEEE
ncbi:MAG: uL15m family ribosomal protein [Candidatus Thermoplasmatota archaeon]|nr:uL15m family ribosomal protein [Candidatus Thermoplasmatota archaeon]MED5485061.1 uL15m family ribosomal protein [Candidatus Thermoplasmatota archaeon]CAI8267832.1 MAG: 50S ribosomal protein L15 [Euryarchaeota archaeon]|tara:strand:+ start:2757 stop:3179 length:423 start_codon:yes stop_codon:yes gene_type:complete